MRRHGVASVRIFGEIDLRDYLESKKNSIIKKIEDEEEDYLLNVSEEQYVEHVKSVYVVDQLTLKTKEIYVSDSEENIPAAAFPQDFYVKRGALVNKNVVHFHIPFDGERELLKCCPSTRIMWTEDVTIDANEIVFSIINWRDNPEEIKHEASRIQNNIIEQCRNVTKQVEDYNESLEGITRRKLSERKGVLQKKNSVLAALELPIKKRDDLPRTFTVPDPVKGMPLIEKPVVTEKGYEPEPTLSSLAYEEILQTIHDLGKTMERLPATYSDKDEEALRDQFLLYLAPRFQGGATGETFNKSGKTDILVRHESSNVFVAECKMWRGKKSLLDAIDQLLSDLTWRDSKTAIVLFVRNKDFSKTLETIEQAVPSHSNFVKFVGKREDTRYSYVFYLQGDPNREVRLAVLSFHIPSNGGGD